MAQDSALEKLKRSPNIIQVAQSRLSLEQRGAEWLGSCPFHSENTPSFTIYTEDTNVVMFKCHGCGKSGNLIQFVQEFDHISFPEAKRKVASELEWREGKENVESTFAPLAPKKEAVTFPLAKIEPAERALEASEPALQWLAGRGLTVETAKKFRLGYVQSVSLISPKHEWVSEGWIVFPTIEGDTITQLKYRSIKGKKSPKGDPGFLRNKGMATCLFNAQTIEPFEDVYVVEGEPDCIIMVQAGYVAVSLPSAGYNPTPAMRDRLMSANRIILAGDTDAAGDAAMRKLWAELRDRTYLLKWPEGMKDANQTYLENCGGDVEVFRAQVEKLKHKAMEQSLPGLYDLRETLRAGNYVPPRDNPARLHFPWAQIDSWGSVLPGDIMAMSATETGTGKTSWVMNILLENALHYGKTVVNFSAELSPAQYAVRAAAYILNKRKDDITEVDLNKAADLMGDAKFYNGYRPGTDWRGAIELLTEAKRHLGADILVLDHLHFLTRSERDETRAQSEAMRALKDLAVQYNCIVIVVGQPRKPLANHRGREAQTQDLKGSESFGSDASQVYILHRDRASNGDDDNMPIFSNETKVKLDKSRESEPKATKLYFDGAKCTFRLLEKTYGAYDE